VPEDGDSTQELPPDLGLFDRFDVRRTPTGPALRPWQRRLLFGTASVIAIVAVVFAVLFTSARVAPKSPLGSVFGCNSSSPCGVAQAYLDDFTGAKYDAMYELISSASHQKFSNPQILTVPGYKYHNAKDYIETRTSSFIANADITHVSGSTGDVKQASSTQVTVPARVIYSSAVFGDIVEDMTIPLVSENGQWKVNWSPGLIVPQLDDPNGDPTYQRHVRADITSGQRGTIYDNCAGSACGSTDILAQDAPVWQVEVNTGQVQNINSLAQALSTALSQALPGVTAAQITTNYNQPWYCGPSGYRLVATLDQQPAGALQQALQNIPGVSLHQTTGRVFPYGASLAAVTGFTAPITADQLGGDTSGYYNQCSLIGDAGVEAWGEQYLRPVEGGTLAIFGRNADGSDQQTPYYTITSKTPANGDDVHTTINLKDQLAAVTALQANHVGQGAGSFAVDPTTGDVLEMASTPACDPNAFAQSNVAAQKGCVQENYALQAAVPTGSVFKIVTLATALENNVITPTQQFQPSTSYQIPGQPNPVTVNQAVCQVPLNAIDALSRSCDLIYYQIAVQVGAKDHTLLPNMARGFGFGSSPAVVGIPDGDQAKGLVPDPTYYQQNNLGGWAPVDDANLAIGQGLFQASPAQVALLSAAIADNGVRMQPELVTAVTNGSATVQTYAPKQVGTLPISSTTLGLLQHGMIGVTQDPEGTSYDVFKGFPILVAGKTGTAESGQQNPHAWFTAYAPATPPSGQPVQPQIAMSVLVTYAGYGDHYASPVCRAVLAAQFNVPSS
jgi:penicillin-binding protein 2